MSEDTQKEAAPARQAKPTSAEANGQLIVSLATVLILGGIATGLIIAGILLKNTSEAWVGVGTIVGVLGNSLNAPTGIGSVIRGAMTTKTGDAQ